MKKLFFICLSFLLASSLSAGNFPFGSSVAQVVKLVKDVSVKKSSEAKIENAKIGTVISDGGQVITKSKSLALIKLTKDNSLLTVRENSILNIYERKDAKGINTITNIEKGTLNFKVQKQEVGDGFQFITPSAVASIRGTSGTIDSDTSETEILLEEGEMFVESKNDPSKNATLDGGKKLTIDSEGNIKIEDLNEEDQKKLNDSKKTNTRKIKIITPFGELEFEYLTD
jgi:hypothetical protein